VVAVLGIRAVTVVTAPPASAEQSGFGVVATIDVAVEPFGATTAPDGRTVWVANAGPPNGHIGTTGHTVTVLDSRTYAIQSVIDVGLFPEDIAFANGGASGIRDQLDRRHDLGYQYGHLAHRTTIRVIRTPAPEVHGVRASPNGKFVIATNYRIGTVSVIATATNTIVANIPVGAEPNDVAFTTNGRRAFVTNQEDTTVSVLSLPSR
jgi:YVTN family beta-propeller protein